MQLTLLLKPSPPPQVANFQSVPLQPGLLAQVAGLHLPEPAQGVGVQGPQVHVAPGGVGPAVVQGHGMNNVQLDANFAMNVAAMADRELSCLCKHVVGLPKLKQELIVGLET